MPPPSLHNHCGWTWGNVAYPPRPLYHQLKCKYRQFLAQKPQVLLHASYTDTTTAVKTAFSRSMITKVPKYHTHKISPIRYKDKQYRHTVATED